MTELEIRQLLDRNESDTLDFKEAAYHLDKAHAPGFVKDVISMANTPRDGDAHILIGVRKHPDGSYSFANVLQHPDDAELQQAIKDRVLPVPRLTYEPHRIEGHTIGVIVIPLQFSGPYLPVRDFGGLRQHTVYWRRGSINDAANGPEQARIHEWFRGREPRPMLVIEERAGYHRVTNIGEAPAVNGTWRTSYRETASVYASFAPGRGRGSQRAAPSGRVDSLATGEAHDPAIYFEPNLHALLVYESPSRRKYWSRYCPMREGRWEFGEGEIGQGDFGCRCRLGESGQITRSPQG